MTRKISRRTALVGAAGALATPFLVQPFLPQPAGAAPDVAGRVAAPRGEAWPEADAMFKRDERWRGADLALSTLLQPELILWHFGDSFIDLEPPFQRAGSAFIRNSIAVQRGVDPASADIEFFWTMQDGQPRAFFDAEQSPVQRQPDSHYWAHSSLVVDDGSKSVLATVFGEWAPPNPVTRLGTTWALVENFKDAPSEWDITYVTGPEVAPAFGAPSEPRYWSLVQEQRGFVEGYGTFHGIVPSNPVYRVRWAVADLLAGNVSSPEWKDGEVWRPLEDFDGAPPSTPAFNSQALQFSVQRDRTGYTMITQKGDFGPMAWDHAPNREGHWGDGLSVIYDPPERQREGVRLYHNWAAPAVSGGGADLVAVYSSNGPNVFEDETLYYPRFVRIHNR